jgi:chorismate dehydratase
MKSFGDPIDPGRIVRLGCIRYLNVAPIHHGIQNGGALPGSIIFKASPSELNRRMSDEALDISPVSSVAYALNQDRWLLLPDFSISCFGSVMSVLLVSRFPFTALSGRTVLLTEDSGTASELLKLLFAQRDVHPVFETGRIQSTADVANAAAGLVIGDAALKGDWKESFPFVSDLGSMWRDLTGLPFVFAVWAVRKEFAEKKPAAVAKVLELLNRSREAGLRNLEQIAGHAALVTGLSLEASRLYYRRLHYDLDPKKLEGLVTFFSLLHARGYLPREVSLSFFRSPHA